MVPLHRALALLPPETAHALALGAAGLALPAGWKSPERLRVSLAGMALPHPIALGAGFDKDAAAYAGLLRLGLAAVEVGTVTPSPQAGNPRPRLFRLPEDRAVINRLGFNNAGHGAAAARLRGREPGRGVVGVNLGMSKGAADPVADYLAGVDAFAGLADYLTINVSSPNTPGLRALQAADRLQALLAAVVGRRDERTAAGGRRVPLLLKIAPDLDADQERAIAEVAVAARVDGLIVSNTTVARPPDLRSRHASETGGLSGAPLRVPALALLRRMHRLVGGAMPLVGVGGIATAADVLERIEAGATAVQIYTALVYEGPGLVRRLVRGLDQLLDRGGHATLAGAVGSRS